MIKARELIKQIDALVQEHGDFNILLQKDQEGNGYNFARGIDFTFVNEDLETTVDTFEETQEYSETFTPTFVIYP